jgi:HTH-type transcriptional regulator / antitoxin HipB
VILNERQYRTSQKKLRDAEQRIRELTSGSGDLLVDDRRAAITSLTVFSAQVRKEIAEFEALRSGAMPVLPITDLRELPLTLIRARIAQQMTQAQLAERLGMKEQQLQRYEMSRYGGARLERLREIAETLGVRIEGSAVVEPLVTDHLAVWRKPLILMTLDSLRERWHRPAQGVLELQKLLVNVDAALRIQLRFHAFVFEPYRFGPFDPFVEDDIERLNALGMVAKQIDAATLDGDAVLIAELRTVPLATTARAHDWLATFANNDIVVESRLKREIRVIVDSVAAEYGALGVSDLMARTYAEHPEWTTRSEIREDMARRAEGRSW